MIIKDQKFLNCINSDVEKNLGLFYKMIFPHTQKKFNKENYFIFNPHIANLNHFEKGLYTLDFNWINPKEKTDRINSCTHIFYRMEQNMDVLRSGVDEESEKRNKEYFENVSKIAKIFVRDCEINKVLEE